MRHDGRQPADLRPLEFKRQFTRQAPGSVLVSMGRTTVLCTCCVEPAVPPFLAGTGKGWLTAEYSMLPGSTQTRKPRDRGGKVDGRSVEIQRLIGRALRTVVDLGKLGERTLWIDCDVLEADGGTRTASINGAFVALIDALVEARKKERDREARRDAKEGEGPVPVSPRAPFPPFVPLPAVPEVVRDSVAAVSVGLLDGRELLDLDYREDRDADVDLNLVMTGRGALIEVQAGGEEATFQREQLDRLLNLGKQGIDAITRAQRQALGANWPLD
jgi:ribonuclease PH